MKLALLGDIHGNQLALDAVLAAATACGVERLLVTGDLVGYYYEPLQVLEMLNAWESHVVRGNHEDMLALARHDPVFLAKVESRYGSGLRVALEQFDDQSLDELCDLPHPRELTLDGCRVLLSHGAPWDNNQYIYPDSSTDLLDRTAVQGFDLIVMGHTHYPFGRVVGGALVVNPGSVGQPRNRQPGAQWAFFDTTSKRLEFHNEQYDSAALVRECQRRNPELPYLAEVLRRK